MVEKEPQVDVQEVARWLVYKKHLRRKEFSMKLAMCLTAQGCGKKEKREGR